MITIEFGNRIRDLRTKTRLAKRNLRKKSVWIERTMRPSSPKSAIRRREMIIEHLYVAGTFDLVAYAFSDDDGKICIIR